MADMRNFSLLLLSLVLTLPACKNQPTSTDYEVRDNLNTLVKQTIATSLSKLESSVIEIGDTLLYPTYGTEDLKWKTNSSKDWVSGFYPGCLWYAYALSGDKKFEQWARSWTTGIEAEKYNANTHDLGFRFMCTYGLGMKLDSTLSESYEPIVLTAAQTMANRFHPEFGALSSNWDRQPIENTTPCVIDIMMNLEILFWAAQNGADTNFAQLAETHAQTTWKDFVRNDGGTYHIVRYEKETGKIIDKGQLQGDVKESTWSRGHAWLVYGLVCTYRFTHNTMYLDWAKLAADYFIRNLNADGIAAWDFQSDDTQTDASASAIVTAALYELIGHLPNGHEREHYSREADRMLAALCQVPYFTGGKDTNCLLEHSVQYYHLDHNVDRPCSFADYYFMEALYRYAQHYLK